MDELQKAILNNCRSNWRKQALVISLAHEQLSLPDGDESYDLLAHQVLKLVDDGKLEAVGNLSNWRGSEVRLTEA